MQAKHFLYAIALLAVVGVAAAFIGYATDTLPMHQPKSQAPMGPTTSAVSTKKKTCGCCAERRAKIQEYIERARARKKAAAADIKSE